MNRILISDNASTTLAAGIAPNSPSLQVVAGGGALFPVLAANQAFFCTLIKSGAPTIREIILVQGHAGGSDNFTNLGRNQSGTGALTWNAGDIVEMRPAAETFANFAQLLDVQGQAVNYAPNDIGVANHYEGVLSPIPNGHVVGMPIRWRAGHSQNAVGATFHDGINTEPMVTPELSPIGPLDIVAGGIYTCIWDGTFFQVDVHRYNFSQLSGSVSNLQVPLSAVLQWEASLVIAFSQMSGQIQNGQIAPSISLPGTPTTTSQAIGSSNNGLATTAFVNPGSGSGFRKNPDGSIDQWGLCNPNGGSASVTFPITFPTAVESIVFGQISGGPTQSWETARSTSGFTVTNSGGQTFWSAKGK